jgi:hypothetical protein
MAIPTTIAGTPHATVIVAFRHVPGGYGSRGRRRLSQPKAALTAASRTTAAAKRTTPITRRYITTTAPAARPWHLQPRAQADPDEHPQSQDVEQHDRSG